MNEVGGGAAVYFDPEDPQSTAVILNEALKNVSGMRTASIANAARFGSGMIEAYLSLYEEVRKERTARAIEELDQPMRRTSSCSVGGIE
jgi:hypothetical protein